MARLNTTLVALTALALLHTFGCSGKKIDENNPQEVYNDAESEAKGHHYTQALEQFKNVKNRFPYSHYAVEAQLRIADVYFEEDSFIEAAGAYETFRDLHPKHPKADYVIFRTGESYFNQLPSSVDRDLTAAHKALDAYNELIKLYPESPNVGDAKKRIVETNSQLAEKETYIADFYYKRSMYDSAVSRYRKITSLYPETDYIEYAYYRLGRSLLRQSEEDAFQDQATRLKAEANSVFKTYLAHFPSGKYAGSAQALLESDSANAVE